MLDAGKFVWNIGIATDDATTVPFDANDTAVFPVTDVVHVRLFQLPQQVARAGLSLPPPA
jgi:hypothetical protein